MIQLARPQVDIEAAVRRLLARVDGVVLANETVPDSFVRAVCRGTPTVLIARNSVLGCDAVLVENQDASQELTEHLLAHGRRRLVFLGDPADSHDVTERYAGFRRALELAGVEEIRPAVRLRLEEASGPVAVEALLAVPGLRRRGLRQRRARRLRVVVAQQTRRACARRPGGDRLRRHHDRAFPCPPA